MTEPTKLKVKGDYSEHITIKMVDGEEIRLVNIDAMTEEQWQKYCRDNGEEPFKRLNYTVG